MNKRIILASTSPRRRDLLAKTGIKFEIIPGGYEEDMTLPMTPYELAKHLSLGKAEAVAAKESGVIIGADTFVIFEDKVLGKPHTPERAREMLKMLRGKTHSIITGYAVIDTQSGTTINGAVESKIYFKNYSDEVIEEYVASGKPLDRAGAYDMGTMEEHLADKWEGDYDAIIGLPVADIIRALKELEVIS